MLKVTCSGIQDQALKYINNRVQNYLLEKFARPLILHPAQQSHDAIFSSIKDGGLHNVGK